MIVRLLLVLGAALHVGVAGATDRILSRRKRYLTFPEGSAVTFLVCCNSVGPFAADLYTFGLDLDMSWDLPNETRALRPIYPDLHGQHRDRRDVYTKLESLFEAAGLDGRACVMQSMCEVSRRLGPHGSPGGIVEEMLKLVFTLPHPGEKYDDPWHGEYSVANHHGFYSPHKCSDLYPGCPVSLIDLVLGPE